MKTETSPLSEKCLHSSRAKWISILLCYFTLALPPAEAAHSPRYAEGQLLVKFRGGPRSPAAERAQEQMKHQVKRSFDFIGWQQIHLPQSLSVEEALPRYRALPEVAAAEPNYIDQAIDSAPDGLTTGTLSVNPDDPRLARQWALAKIGASDAWEFTTGDSNIVVAVIDSGINYGHEDLQDNLWRNPGEIAANGVDDDANGYVDDIYGIDTVDDVYGNDSDLLDEGANGFNHGSACAGLIGALGKTAKELLA